MNMGRNQLALFPEPAASPRTEGLRFYLGTHHPAWLATANVPLFISYHRLAGRRTVPRAICEWALDSGGFTELGQHGTWRIDPRTYARDVQWFMREVGLMRFAAVQDWMCEPGIRMKTALSVQEHQRRTVSSWVELKTLAPDVPWLPVLQGWTLGEYLEHVEMYDQADASWRDGLVGLGSVCRRQETIRAQALIQILAEDGLQLHAFGFKRRGLPSVARHLKSSDSLAWSLQARRAAPLPGCTHRSCANCLDYALQWRAELLADLTVQDAPHSATPHRDEA